MTEGCEATHRGDMPIPPVLYKYYAFNEWTADIFERNEIYFQSPDGFNDPFDSKLSLVYEGTEEQRILRLMGALQEVRRRQNLPPENEQTLRLRALNMVKQDQDIARSLSTVTRSPEKLRKRMGIYCMTTKRDDILMWSHYAAAHTGFCLEFSTDDPFFQRAEEAPLCPVYYSADRPCLNLIKYDGYREDIWPALCTKAGNWEYEHEWRLIDFTRGPGIHEYPAKVLTGVILGCRILPENRHRITQWCRKRDPRPTMFWAEVKDREFGLDIRPIPWDDDLSRSS